MNVQNPVSLEMVINDPNPALFNQLFSFLQGSGPGPQVQNGGGGNNFASQQAQLMGMLSAPQQAANNQAMQQPGAQGGRVPFIVQQLLDQRTFQCHETGVRFRTQQEVRTLTTRMRRR